MPLPETYESKLPQRRQEFIAKLEALKQNPNGIKILLQERQEILDEAPKTGIGKGKMWGKIIARRLSGEGKVWELAAIQNALDDMGWKEIS